MWKRENLSYWQKPAIYLKLCIYPTNFVQAECGYFNKTKRFTLTNYLPISVE